jgi:hypothetical protein
MVNAREPSDLVTGASGVGPFAQWSANLADGRIELQRCEACGHVPFPPRRVCPACGCPDLPWHAASRHGTVHAFTIVARPIEQGGPYNVVLVDLDEGPRLMSRVEGVSDDALHIGLKVTADIVSREGSPTLVVRPRSPTT